MKRALILLCGILIVSVIYGKQVDYERAKKIAAAFLQTQGGELKSVRISDLQLVEIRHQGVDRLGVYKSARVDFEKNRELYLFKQNGEGFVLVAGDDLARPILAYSAKQQIDEQNLPVNFLKWLEEYKRQIRYLRKMPAYKSAKALNAWALLEQGTALEKASTIAVSPLMTTAWDQSPYYNDLCPQANWFSSKAVTGCVATAMAQIMKYHNYPEQGRGINTYYHSNNSVTYGNLTANFGNTMYSWSNMPNVLSASSSQAQINAVATLMFHCGVSVNMDYSPNTSGAWVTEAKSDNGASSELAFKKYFGYDETTVRGVQRDDLSTAEWVQAIKNELDAGRPVMFAGVGDGGGHAFVADGYDNNNFFHMNWGWGGLADGYYSTDAFEPYDLGTGAGAGSYNWYQRIVVGIKPPAQTADQNMYLYSDINVPEIYQFNEFEITLKIYNMGASFYGELGAALFDESGDFVEFIDSGSLSNNPIVSRKVYDISFESEGLSVYPGFYYVGIYYKPPGENWIALPEVPDGGVSNFVGFEVLSPFTDSDIMLYDSIHISPSALVTGQQVSITADIANLGDYTYYGEFGAGLFTRQGDVVQTFEVFDIGSLESWYYDTYHFSSEQVEADPGAYLIALVHFPNGGDDQYVVAPADFANPVHVNVTLPPLSPDSFEDNNAVDNAYVFDVNFEDNYSGFYTIETNLHNADDQDYYTIDLPAGYTYEISARVNDSYSSMFDDEEYTCDVLWAHSTRDYEWSEMYDDEMESTYKFYNGGQVYFGVIPYFEGETGTYSLVIEIERKLYTTGYDEILADKDNSKIYPNPCKNKVQVQAAQTIDLFYLYNSTAALIERRNIHQKNFSIETENLKAGVYFLKLVGKQHSETHKIIKKD